MTPEQHAKVLEARERNRVTPEGRALGENMVRLTEPAIARLADEGEPDERCKSCAFRLGTVPNGCPQTQLDALKAVIEDVPFMCHQANRAGWPCHHRPYRQKVQPARPDHRPDRLPRQRHH